VDADVSEQHRGRARPQHSAASLRASRNPGHRLSIAVAFIANVVVAIAKLGAALITGSSALLAEAVHSGADSINQVLLGVSLRRARRPADEAHPFGYGGARFVWAFLAAISSFVIGGCVSIGLAINDLIHGSEIGHSLVAWIVLAVAAIADGSSLAQTVKQARSEAARWGQPTLAYLRHTSEPTLRALAFEDSAALAGVAIAATGLLIHDLGGPASSDAIASLLIGILLGVTAIGLARPLGDLLVGKSMSPERLARARQLLSESPAVEEILDVYALHVAPEDVLLAARVHPADDQDGERLGALIDELDVRLRSELPEIGEVFIDVTAHHRARGHPGESPNSMPRSGA
jgi:cation diffusion facilitator family transporter